MNQRRVDLLAGEIPTISSDEKAIAAWTSAREGLPRHIVAQLLVRAAQRATPALLQAMIASGVDLHATWDLHTLTAISNGSTVLHEVRSVHVARWIVAHAPALVNVRDDYGNTPLHRASARSQQEIAQLLLNAGADPLATNNQNALPCDVNHGSEVGDMLRAAAAAARAHQALLLVPHTAPTPL